MRKLAAISFLVLLMSACSAGYYDRNTGASVSVGPEWWGTVTYVDPYASRFDVDYYNGGRHYTRPVYYAPATVWGDGLSYSAIHRGDRIWVNGQQHRGRWTAHRVWRY